MFPVISINFDALLTDKKLVQTLFGSAKKMKIGHFTGQSKIE